MVADIHDFIETLPMGYDTKIGPEGTGLSQGQRQRILIARAIFKDPKILLFDEATNSLDSLTESVITSNLNKFIKTRTAVVVAHRLSTIRNADQIVIMENGKIVEVGTQIAKLHDQYVTRTANQFSRAVTAIFGVARYRNLVSKNLYRCNSSVGFETRRSVSRSRVFCDTSIANDHTINVYSKVIY